MPSITPFSKLALYFALGIAACHLAPEYAATALLTGAGCLTFLPLVLLIRVRRTVLLRIALSICSALCICCLGYSWMDVRSPTARKDHYLNGVTEGVNQLVDVEIISIERSSSFYQKYLAGINCLDNIPTSGKVLMRIPLNDTVTPIPGDSFRLITQLKKPNEAMNPGQFDYRDLLKGRGIFHMIDIHRSVIVTQDRGRAGLRRSLSLLRTRLVKNLEESTLGAEAKGLIQGMVLGNRDKLSEELLRDYSRAGVMHLLAISGLHVGLLYLFLGWLLRPLWLIRGGYKFTPFLLVIILWAYAMFTGLSPSVTRATTLFSILALSSLISRKMPSLHKLSLAFLLLLIYDPKWLLELGFQMSFLAVSGILLVQPLIARRIRPRNLVLRYLRDLISVSLAAQLAVLPLSLFHFHQFPAAFLIANLLAIPLMTPLLILGLICAVWACFAPPPMLINTLFGWMVELLNSCIQTIGGWDVLVIDEVPFKSNELILGYALIATWMLLQNTEWRYRRESKWCITLLIALGFLARYHHERPERLYILHQIGSSTVVHYSNGHMRTWQSTSKADIYSIETPTDLKRELAADSMETYKLRSWLEISGLNFLVLDSLGIYPPDIGPVDILLLTHQPKVNLDIVLRQLCPRQVVADGSNFRNMIGSWSESCRRQGIPFHFTGVKKAFELDLDSITTGRSPRNFAGILPTSRQW